VSLLLTRAVDDSLFDDWADWVARAARRFGAAGYGESATALASADIAAFARSPDMLFSAAYEDASGAKGLVIVMCALWETSVLSRSVAKVAWFAADTFEIARALAVMILDKAEKGGVVLISASPGHSPLHMHAALSEAGFHVGSQTFTVHANLERIAPAVARIPLRGTFREARPGDTEAIARLARHGFEDQRFTADPFFPKEWGRDLLAAWGRNLALGAADSVVVAEAGQEVIGFVSMTLDAERRRSTPALLAVDQRYKQWGVGTMLVRIMFDWYRERGLHTLVGGTEKSNLPINALYVRLGVAFVDSNIVYHASPALRAASADTIITSAHC
jgi:ribosomal protein S18 acetylase RimI-like enzyme